MECCAKIYLNLLNTKLLWRSSKTYKSKKLTSKIINLSVSGHLQRYIRNNLIIELFVIEMKTTISVASVAHSVSTWLENHTYLAQKLPWSRWRCFQDEAQPLH